MSFREGLRRVGRSRASPVRKSLGGGVLTLDDPAGWLSGEDSVAMSRDRAMKISTVNRCVEVLSNSMCGQLFADHKVMALEGTGSLTLYKVDSGLIQKQQNIQDGVDDRFTIVTALKDPDNYGAERIAIYNVSFDDLTLADWQRAAVGKITAPFTFTRFEPLDQIGVN